MRQEISQRDELHRATRTALRVRLYRPGKADRDKNTRKPEREREREKDVYMYIRGSQSLGHVPFLKRDTPTIISRWTLLATLLAFVLKTNPERTSNDQYLEYCITFSPWFYKHAPKMTPKQKNCSTHSCLIKKIAPLCTTADLIPGKHIKPKVKQTITSTVSMILGKLTRSRDPGM